MGHNKGNSDSDSGSKQPSKKLPTNLQIDTFSMRQYHRAFC